MGAVPARTVSAAYVVVTGMADNRRPPNSQTARGGGRTSPLATLPRLGIRTARGAGNQSPSNGHACRDIDALV